MAAAGGGIGGCAEQAEPAISWGQRGPFGEGAKVPVVRIHGEYVEVRRRSFHFFFCFFFVLFSVFLFFSIFFSFCFLFFG